MIIVKYETEDEAKTIIEAKQSQGYTLIEVQNITEGNFLGFLEPGEAYPINKSDMEQRLTTAEEETAALNLAIIDLWETIANGGAA